MKLAMLTLSILMLFSAPASSFTVTLVPNPTPNGVWDAPGASECKTFAHLDLVTDRVETLTQPFASAIYSESLNDALCDGEFTVNNQRIESVAFELRRDPNSTGNLRLSQINTRVYFTVDTDVAYEIDGSFAVTDDGDPGQVILELRLTHDASWPDLPDFFYSTQHSQVTSNETLTVGETGGDFDNFVSGTQTGILEPGYIYEFDIGMHIGSAFLTEDSATAIGNVSIVFSEIAPTVLPSLSAPGSFALAGALILVSVRLRRLRHF